MKSGALVVRQQVASRSYFSGFAWVVVVPVGRPLPHPSLRESSRRSGRPLRSRRADTSCLCDRPGPRRRSDQVDVLFAPRATSNCTPGPGLCPPQRQSVRISCRCLLAFSFILNREEGKGVRGCGGKGPGGPAGPFPSRKRHYAPASARLAPLLRYASRYVSMCQMIVVNRRITATRPIFAPRRRLIPRYQARSRASCLSTCITSCPSRNRASLLPSLLMEPSRWFFSPELRHDGVSPQ